MRLIRRGAQRHEPGAKSSRNLQIKITLIKNANSNKSKRLGAYSFTERRLPGAKCRRTLTISITRRKLKQFAIKKQAPRRCSGAQRREPGALDLVSRTRLKWESAYARACSHRTHARTYARYSGNCFTEEGVPGNKNAHCCSSGSLFRWGKQAKPACNTHAVFIRANASGLGGIPKKRTPRRIDSGLGCAEP